MTSEQSKFVKELAKYVQKYAADYGIKVCSPVIAQGILESGWGKSKLAATYHNYFGLKCGSKWTGKYVNLTTSEEYTVGTKTTIKDNFRAYDSMEEGVKGYFEFLHALSRYDNLQGIVDPKKYLETIKADGYATSSTYVADVYKVITSNALTEYDLYEEKKGAGLNYYRNTVVDIMKGWVGKKESDGTHRSIIDLYNTIRPLPSSYQVQYTDAWCATTCSAAFHQAGYDAIFPLECSCSRLIAKAKTMGCWTEDDAYVAQPGDCVLYDWQDNGSGDNTGNPDHIGMIEKVNKKSFTVIEGNYSDSVKRRVLTINGKNIRGFVTPAFTATSEEDAAVVVVKKEKAESKKVGYSGKFPVLPTRHKYRQGDGITTLVNYKMQIKRVQMLVNWICEETDGFTKLAVDGKYGPKTAAGVGMAQKVMGISVDKEFGQDTLRTAKKYKR